MRICILFAIVHLLAALQPLRTNSSGGASSSLSFPGWPTEFEGETLEQLELSKKEKGFIRNFPGKIARFTDGSRELVIRYLAKPSRKLHPAADCLKSVGFGTTPKPIKIDRQGKHWGCISAVRKNRKLKVCERIYDHYGASFSDVSSWYWAAMLGKSRGPWWAVTVSYDEDG